MHRFSWFSLLSIPLAHSLSIDLSPKVPKNASAAIDPQFLGFGIEAGSFPDYTGNKSHPNGFSLNMFSTLSNRTGSPLPIRVGGTSMDHSIFDPSQKEAVNYPDNRTEGLRSNMTLGGPWIESFSFLKEAKWILMVPLARYNLSNAVHFANASIGKMLDGTFEALEIGNEVNLYPGGVCKGTYSLSDYVHQWTTYADVLSKNLSLHNGPDFWACSFASNTKWNVSTAFKDGLVNETGKVKAISQHYYQTYGGMSLQDTLLNHTETSNKTSTSFHRPVNYLRKNLTQPIPFILGEVGSALGNGHKDYTLQASLGSAIWTVDWMLYAMSIGVSRINMQMITQAPFSAWQPIPATVGGQKQPAQVLGGWYGHVFVADILGAGKGKKLQIAEWDLGKTDNGPGAVVAYSIYHDSTLAQIVLLNEELWHAEPGKERPGRNITLGPLGGVDKVQVQKLTGDNGTAQHNISWAGQRWSKEKNGHPETVANDTIVLDVKNKAIDVEVKATEALLISLMR
ncbi:hypothetical protein NA57DRAFT_79600 [Rhizodiscina lignyota]|uniref:Beta-glucuronidase C-terminal domain-containing protein n=1 Tax=Rhizodiscina lignyota TaxID=1504668 RepID=A0A9P4M5A6_9PEZI|nr:hypothetical protein NA57DRAFT_79600 [Rhizodiscina lignyota]